MTRHVLRSILPAMLIWGMSACAPDIGDSCGNSVDCSVNGSRICDVAQPNGYCTVIGCEPDTCPGGSVCVEFRGMPDRTAVTFCMEGCNSDGACRKDYVCVDPDTDERMREGYPEVSDGIPIAEVVDVEGSRPEASFCIANPDIPADDI